MEKITTLEMEIAVAKFFNYRLNIVVPNISWGMFNHECDLIKLTPGGYCTEIEIKVSLNDLKKDKEKRHKHNDPKIKYLYFAIPEYLEQHIEHIPDKAGILIVTNVFQRWLNEPIRVVKQVRKPKMQNNYKFSQEERIKLLSLMAMRIWRLKKRDKKRLKIFKFEIKEKVNVVLNGIGYSGEIISRMQSYTGGIFYSVYPDYKEEGKEEGKEVHWFKEKEING